MLWSSAAATRALPLAPGPASEKANKWHLCSGYQGRRGPAQAVLHFSPMCFLITSIQRRAPRPRWIVLSDSNDSEEEHRLPDLEPTYTHVCGVASGAWSMGRRDWQEEDASLYVHAAEEWSTSIFPRFVF